MKHRKSPRGAGTFVANHPADIANLPAATLQWPRKSPRRLLVPIFLAYRCERRPVGNLGALAPMARQRWGSCCPQSVGAASANAPAHRRITLGLCSETSVNAIKQIGVAAHRKLTVWKVWGPSARSNMG